MNFDLGPDQRDAAAGAREFFAGSTSPAAARAALEGARVEPGRKALADIGFLGITVSEAARLVADAGVRLLGDDAVYAAASGGDDRWQRTQAWVPGIAIAGGTDQVLRNIIGERVLGLPPEPRSDKTGPFAGGRR